MARRLIVVLTFAAVAAAFPAGAEARHQWVLCGNFGGEFADPRHARQPVRCDVTRLGRRSGMSLLRRMNWTRWSTRAVGRGRVNGRQRVVRLRGARPCGRYGEYEVYSQIRIGRGPWQPILYCGD